MVSLNRYKRPISIDLFAGAGGMTLGFEQAGFDVIGAVEINPIHCATHQYNFPFWSILCRSVTEVTGAELRCLFKLDKRDIDVVFGGPPCQGFSMMGKRALDDERNVLMYHFVRLVAELKPKYFVIENVKGITQGQHKFFIEEIIEKFQFLGYKIRQPYQVLNACCYGIPQDRQRLFLLGSREDLALPEYPLAFTKPAKPNHNQNTNRVDLLPNSPTVYEAICDLPEVEDYPELLERDWIFANSKQNHSDYSNKLKSLEGFQEDYSYEREFNPNILTSSLRTQHTPESVARFLATPHGKNEPISRFYKLHPQGICNTLRAGTPSNRGAYTSARPIHPFTPRCITVREAARLHSYPDWFRFHVTKWHGFRQIGNSVPPLLAKAIAQEIIKILNIETEEPSEKYKLGNPQLLQLNMTQSSRLYHINPDAIQSRIRKK